MRGFTRRDIAFAGGAVFALTAGGAQAAKPSAATDPLALVDPELREAARSRPSVNFSRVSLAQARQGSIQFPPILPAPAPAPVERMIPGSPGQPDVRVMLISPAPNEAARPAILHIHGGGFVIGDARTYKLRDLQETALQHGCVVVSVDYRLAPETTYAGSIEDNYAALRWLHRNADQLGVDPTRIAVLGASAGGGHAALLAIATRDRGEFPIAFQALIYPMLDDRTGSTVAAPAHIGNIGWTRASNRFGWSAFLGVPAGSRTAPPGAVPARVQNLAGLPPAFIGVGALDLFVQEDIAYASRLLAAGVPTELYVVPGAFHGFDNFAPEARITKVFTAAWNSALSRAFRKA